MECKQMLHVCADPHMHCLNFPSLTNGEQQTEVFNMFKDASIPPLYLLLLAETSRQTVLLLTRPLILFCPSLDPVDQRNHREINQRNKMQMILLTLNSNTQVRII